NVEPAPEIVPEPLGGVVAVFALELAGAVVVVPVLAVVSLDLLELPHAAMPAASSRQPASTTNLFLITASPDWLFFARLSPVGFPAARLQRRTAALPELLPRTTCAQTGVHSPTTVFIDRRSFDVNIS